MAIRTACFVAAILIPDWWRWLFVVGAVVLPYVAVVVANAGREAPGSIDEPVSGRELPPGSTIEEGGQ